MKKITIINIFIIVFTSLYGQKEYTDGTNTAKATTYLGMLGGPAMFTENSKLSGFVTLRAGGTITWLPNKYFSLFGLGAGEINEAGAVTPFSLMSVKFSPAKNFFVTAGKMATPMTELRAMPTTGAGQFEPWTRAQILGAAVGGKLTVNIEKFSFVGGVFKRNNDVSAEIGIRIPHTKISGYFLTEAKIFGSALTFDTKHFSATVVYNQNQNFGLLNIFEIPKTGGWNVYTDLGLNTNQELIRGEAGIFKSFSLDGVNALLGAGYSEEKKLVKGYVFLFF